MALDEQQQIERAARIKQLREESPYTQAALADLIGVTPRAYQRWEEGGGIEWDHLERLAEIHDVEVMWIHRGSGRGPTPEMFRPDGASELREAVAALESKIDQVLGRVAQLGATVLAVQSTQQDLQARLRRLDHRTGEPRNG